MTASTSQSVQITTLDETIIETFREFLCGDLITPNDARYDAARRV